MIQYDEQVIFMNQLYILHYTDPNPAFELFVNRPFNEVRLIYQLYENEKLFENYFRNGRTPFALNKRNRTVFYISSDDNCISKGNIDDTREVCSHIYVCKLYHTVLMHVCMDVSMYVCCVCGILVKLINLYYFSFSYFSHLIMGLFLLLCPMTG